MSSDWKSLVAFFLDLGFDISGEGDRKVVLQRTVYKNGLDEIWETVVIFKDDLDASYVTFETNMSVPGKFFCAADGLWYDSEEDCKSYYVLLKDKYEV